MKIYIAGPMTGRPEHNVPAFDAVVAKLCEMGYDAVSPPDITRANPQPGIRADGSIDRAAYSSLVRLDLIALLDCAAVVVLPGWSVSRGAKLELAVASAIGIPVYGLSEFVAMEFTARLLDMTPHVFVEGAAYLGDRVTERATRCETVSQDDQADGDASRTVFGQWSWL